MTTKKKLEGFNPGTAAAASARDQVLKTPETLEEILKHLNVDDLKSCSVLNKRWNSLVRSYMQHHRKILASYKKKNKDGNFECPPCEQLKMLNQILANWTPSSVIPFTGIMIDVQHESNGAFTSSSKCEECLDVNFSKIIKSIPLRRLVVKSKDGHSNMPKTCPVISFLRRWIPIQDEWIEELEFIDFPYVVCRKFLKLGELEMSALKTMRLSFSFNDSSLKCLMLAMFCKNAPNLKELQVVPMDLQTLPFLPESSYGAIDGLSLTEILDESMEECLLSLAKHEPALRRLELAVIPDTAEFITSFKLVCRQLLKSSQSSLENLSIEILDDQSFLAVFQHLFLDPMQTVKSLKFVIPPGNNLIEPANWFPVLDNFDFNFFPCVEHIKIVGRVYDATGFYNPAEPHPFPALSVISLQLNVCFTNAEVAYFQRMFPNITELHYGCGWRILEPSFPQIWAHWPKLRELTMDMENEWHINWDAEMCGIFQDEVDFLQQQTTEYLQTVHIVPIRPALTSVSKMEILRIEINGRGTKYAQKGTALFSGVTCCLAFDRMEHLTVIVNCAATEKPFSALEHLKQHVLFTSEKSKFKE